MEQRFHVSRRTAQLVRRRLPYCENAAYPTSWYPKSEKGRQRKDQASVSGRMIVADGICNDRSVQTNEALHHILSQGVRISSQSPTELKNFKLGATPKDWKTRQYTHSPRLDRNKVVSDQLSRRSLRSGLRYHLPYMPFSQASFTSSICGLPPAGRCSGRHFSVSAAVRPIESNPNDTADYLNSLLLCWKTIRACSIVMIYIRSNRMNQGLKSLRFVRDCASGRLNIGPNRIRPSTSTTRFHQI